MVMIHAITFKCKWFYHHVIFFIFHFTTSAALIFSLKIIKLFSKEQKWTYTLHKGITIYVKHCIISINFTIKFLQKLKKKYQKQILKKCKNLKVNDHQQPDEANKNHTKFFISCIWCYKLRVSKSLEVVMHNWI